MKNKYHVRTLKKLNRFGQVLSVRKVYDLDAMIRDICPELANEPQRYKNKKGDLLPFPK